MLRTNYLAIATCLLVGLLGAETLHAQQHALKVVDAVTNQPLEGVVMIVKGSGGEEHQYLSDKDGAVVITASFPVRAWLRHVSYESISDSLLADNVSAIRMNPSVKQLDDLVVTGQYAPSSVRNSVYDVRLIGRKEIEQSGAVQLSTLLEKELNIRFRRDNATGSSGISLQGIAGQNVKVLVNGVPVVGRSGVNNEIDLNQIDLQSVERVEIVEGPMAVNFGADALAGVINIITTQGQDDKLVLNARVHSETVGDEFSFFEQGIHNPSLTLGYKPVEPLTIRVNGRINKFGGWKGDETGRQHAWYPKMQYFGGTEVGFIRNEFNIQYTLDYLNETLSNYGQEIDDNPLKDPTAIDEEYRTIRWIHRVQSDWTVAGLDAHTDLAYTDYSRNTHQFVRNLVTDDKTTTTASEQDSIAYTSFFFRNTLDHTFGKVQGQAGIDGTFETASGTTLSDGDKHITDLGLFTSAEWQVLPSLKLRPGLRFTYNSMFDAVLIGSLNSQWNIAKDFQWRLSAGRGYRAPSVRELYHEFIDSNHNILGNPDLKPEYSFSVNSSFSYLPGHLIKSVQVRGFYNHIRDRITYVSNTDQNTVTTYENIDTYNTLGAGLSSSWVFGTLTLQTGVAVTGLYQSLSESEDVPGYVYTPEVNALLNYNYQPFRLSFDVNYKFNGRTSRYFLDESGDGEPVLGYQEGYHLMDVSVQKLIGKSFSLTGGIRNLFNVQQVNSTSTGGDAHSGGSTVPIGYGRSYFLTMNYQLKLN